MVCQVAGSEKKARAAPSLLMAESHEIGGMVGGGEKEQSLRGGEGRTCRHAGLFRVLVGIGGMNVRSDRLQQTHRKEGQQGRDGENCDHGRPAAS